MEVTAVKASIIYMCKCKADMSRSGNDLVIGFKIILGLTTICVTC